MRLFIIGVVYAACTLGCEDTPDVTELVERATSRPSLRVFARQTCSGSQLPGQLQDATDVLGITFSHELGAVRDYLDGLANDLGGVAIGDLDGDHFPDLYFANTNGPDEVYMTAGRGALQWSASSLPWSGKTVTFADIDGDEVLDAVLAESWARNRGDGTFDAPIALPVTPDVLWLGFSAGDIDGDGDLDLFGSGHASTTGDGLPARSGLFENLGGATFATRSELLGERRVEGSTFIVSLVDLNRDGLPELYETNDAVSLADINVDPSDNFRPGNRLFLNEGGWKLTDISLESGTDSVLSAMGIAIGDYNRDGHTDFYVTSMLPEPNILLAGQGSLRWQEGQVEALAQSLYDEHDVGWGAVFVDLNADGWEDLYVAHGFHTQGEFPFGQPSNADQQRNVILANAQGRFVDVTDQYGGAATGWSRSVAVGDLNRDGFPDLVVTNADGQPAVYLNGCHSGIPTLTVSLRMSNANTHAVGAIVRAGEQMRHIMAGGTGLYGSSVPEAIYAFPPGTETVDLDILWPGGRRTTEAGIPVNSYVILSDSRSGSDE